MHWSEPLPYPVHTNRELGMMLRGEKPLAVFTDGHGCFPPAVERYLRLFDRHVASGRFVRRDFVIPYVSRRTRGMHTIFALADEAWRIDAMIVLRTSDTWTFEQEREEGCLLGYAEWQNDIWLSRWPSR